jgi:hypothetical protein
MQIFIKTCFDYSKFVPKTEAYHLTIDDEGKHWVYDPENAERIWVGLPFPNKSRGCAGRIITFDLVTGEQIKIHGPWHSAPGLLYLATGIDLGDKYYTSGVIARDRDYITDRGFLYDGVLYYQEIPRRGQPDAIEQLAQEYSEIFKSKIWYYCQNEGGSSHSYVE